MPISISMATGPMPMAMTDPLSCDGHVHTSLCGHATGEMEDYVQAALAQGLAEIIFLEHFEWGIDYFERTWLFPADFVRYQQEGERLSARYGGRIKVGVGVEVGLNLEGLAETRAFIDSYPWARVGLSYHFLACGQGGHLNMVSRKARNTIGLARLGHDEVLRLYLAGLLRGVRELPVSAVCHLDAVLRHSADVQWQDEHRQLVTAILHAMAERGVALEVNTSGLALGRDAFPAAWIRDQARAIGLNFVYGSDAHRPEDVGRYFNSDQLKETT
ncbi:MAG: histidinol-phosphatase [Thermodesulfobacteriota bacterium]